VDNGGPGIEAAPPVGPACKNIEMLIETRPSDSARSLSLLLLFSIFLHACDVPYAALFCALHPGKKEKSRRGRRRSREDLVLQRWLQTSAAESMLIRNKKLPSPAFLTFRKWETALRAKNVLGSLTRSGD
jgi:hypothetical protein